MNKRYRNLILVLICILALITPWTMWQLQKDKPINAWIIDKTVPTNDYREHRGLFWVLNHLKFSNSLTAKPFDYRQDYYGYFPTAKGDKIKEISPALSRPDLIYIADSYGVYQDDFEEQSAGAKSPLVYGGLDSRELLYIKQNLAGSTLIAEFNTMGSPTSPEVREQLEAITGAKSLGWSACYFNNLTPGAEIPAWMPDRYEEQEKKKWPYQGAGMVLISEDDKILVLQSGQDLGKKGLTISINKEYADDFEAKSSPYYYWCEWVQPEQGAEVLAHYTLDLTAAGKKKLEQIGVPAQFPAVVRKSPDNYTAYYFAGDFADHLEAPHFYQYQGLATFKKLVTVNSAGSSRAFFWRFYVPLMQEVLSHIKPSPETSRLRPEAYQDGNILLNSRIEGRRLQIYRNGKWQDLFLKGVNLGTALPGYWFTEFPASSSVYTGWFEKIAAMNANCIRVYTLLDPLFYDSLYYYNRMHPQQPIYVLQGIWPEEHPPQDNLLAPEYLQAFKKEIEYTLDAVHGHASIAERQGRAYGEYKSDISPYILAYLPGRELEPQEVLATDEANPGYRFQGDYFALKEGSPSEGFLAWSCDYTMGYEEKTYGWQHPLAPVSWPTLDPIEHDSEWNMAKDKSLEYNDCAQIDINHIDCSPEVKAGFFGAYHIYPNYPDFMNNEPAYNSYSDEQGRLRYGGYLQEFIQQHQKYPALVAEFGLATGLGNAHSNPDGYNHGGLTERQQGEGIVRMIKAIEKEGYMGGVVFEWMDEWAKKTWTTEPFMIPYENHVYWHNMVDPEQNYGIIAMESLEPANAAYVQENQGYVEKVEMKANESYLYIDIYSQETIDFASQRWWIGLDTYARQRGDTQFPGWEKAKLPSGMEFMIKLEGEKDGSLLVIPSYNPASYKFSSQASSSGYYEEMRPIINKARVSRIGTVIPEIRGNNSTLRYGDFKLGSSHWFYEGKILHIRIPWTSINISDPSTRQVLDDPRTDLMQLERDMLKTVTTEGIVPYVLVENRNHKDIIGIFPGKDEFTNTKPYLWPDWNKPQYNERPKESYSILKEAFTQIN